MPFPYQVQKKAGSTLRFSSPENTTILPAGEYEGTIKCICPWEIIINKIKGVNETELPREFRTGNLTLAFMQRHKPGPGLMPNCPYTKKFVARGRRGKVVIKKRRPSLSKGRAPRKKDGTEVKLRYQWLKRR